MAVNLPCFKTKKQVVKKSTSFTCINTSKIQYTWRIHNFRLCPSQVGDMVSSPTFSGGVQNEYNFQLIAYPNGEDENYERFVSLQLRFVPGKRSQVQAKCKFNILPDQGTRCHEYSDVINLNDNTSPSIKNPCFIERKVLFEKTHGILPDDVLTIVCDIIIVEGITTTAHDNYAEESRATMHHQWQNDLSDLFESSKFCDVTLTTCGQEIQAHKAILAARSPVFTAMFDHVMKEQEENQVYIIDVDYDVLKEMLRYIYSGNITILDEMAVRLLMAADKYGLETLKNECENALGKSIAVENAADLLVLGDIHSAGRLKNEALDFICTHAEEVIETTSYRSLRRTHPHLINEMIRALANKII